MQEAADMELLREYAHRNSEAAFAALVTRHVNLVYSAALRKTGNAHAAEEITQAVFILLARKADRLRDGTILSGWLYQTARLTSASFRRAEFRRVHREQEAYVQSLSNETEPELWTQIGPLLDDAMGQLGEKDRNAVVLRFFEGKSFQEIGTAFGASENAAKKRVAYALEKLRKIFAKRGVTVGASGLVGVLSANAVQAAPVGLAVTISTAAALAGTSLATTATATAIKTIAMTTLQKTFVTATIAAAVGTGIYEARQASRLRDENRMLIVEQQQLSRERDDAVKRLTSLSTKPVPRLPAPRIQATTSQATPPDDLQSTNLYARLKENTPSLTTEQVEAYLKTNGRSAATLLAAFRTSHDPSLLEEAMQKYPNDPQVDSEAAFRDLSPEEHRRWLDAFKQSAPDNALANYISALDYFKTGQPDQAVQEFLAASGKQCQDYTSERMQADEEAYREAGYSVAEAKAFSTSSVTLPQLSDVKESARQMVDLAKAYRQAGDENSAQAALQMAASLGQRYANGSTGECLIDRLVGTSMERNALSAMNPTDPYGGSGQTVQDRLNALLQQRTMLKELDQQFQSLQEKMSTQDWISYVDRWRTFGQVAGLQWVISKYGQK
jgi:RNA polymerase sigma factor (sigma-70 family)